MGIAKDTGGGAGLAWGSATKECLITLNQRSSSGSRLIHGSKFVGIDQIELAIHHGDAVADAVCHLANRLQTSVENGIVRCWSRGCIAGDVHASPQSILLSRARASLNRASTFCFRAPMRTGLSKYALAPACRTSARRPASPKAVITIIGR